MRADVQQLNSSFKNPTSQNIPVQPFHFCTLYNPNCNLFGTLMMNSRGDRSVAGGANRTGEGRRKRSKTRTKSRKAGFEGDPIRTEQERASKSLLLGDIEFMDAASKKGEVELEGDLMKCIKSVWTEQREKKQEVPTKIDIRSLKLGALNSMSRPDKRKMLRELANKDKYPREQIKVVKINGSTLPETFGKERVVSLATVLVLHIGLQAGPEEYDTGEVSTTGQTTTVYPNALFAELVGCADAKTMKELSYYLCPPLMTLERLPDFIHCAVRQIARSQREDRSPEPVALVIQTVDAISTALEQLNNKKEKEKKSTMEKVERVAGLKSLLTRTLSKAHRLPGANDQSEDGGEARKKENSRDLGCHAGLLLAGVQRYICKAQASDKDKEELCNLFIDVSSGLLTGIPVGGFVFGALGSVAKYGAHAYFDKSAGKLRQMNRRVRRHFDELVAAPIFFDGEFVEKKEGGEETVIEVNWEEFSKWYDQVISWNEVQNEIEMIKLDEKKDKAEMKGNIKVEKQKKK